jgi:hypothetical protein
MSAVDGAGFRGLIRGYGPHVPGFRDDNLDGNTVRSRPEAVVPPTINPGPSSSPDWGAI